MRKHFVTLLALTLLFSACQETLEERCSREARDFTRKHCPMTVGNDVVMDSMTFDAATHHQLPLYPERSAGRCRAHKQQQLARTTAAGRTQLHPTETLQGG